MPPGSQPGAPPDEAQLAIDAWNYMGGTIAWEALPYFVERFGIVDVDAFIEHLVTIRQHFIDHQHAQQRR